MRTKPEDLTEQDVRHYTDELTRGVCELLSTNGLLAAGVELRYSVDFVQVLRDGSIAATFRPSALATL